MAARIPYERWVVLAFKMFGRSNENATISGTSAATYKLTETHKRAKQRLKQETKSK